MLNIKNSVAVITGGGGGIGLALADFAIAQYGRIDLVAPFAGIIKDAMMIKPDRETGKVTRKMSLEQFKSVMDINLTGVFLTVRECAERMVNHEPVPKCWSATWDTRGCAHFYGIRKEFRSSERR